MIRHLYEGLCPDGVMDDPPSDPNCPACTLMLAQQAVLDAAVAWHQAEPGSYRGTVTQERALHVAIAAYLATSPPR